MSEVVQTRFPRQPRRGLILGFSTARVGGIVTVAALVVIGLYAGVTIVLYAAMGLAVIVTVTIFVRVRGRYVVEWFPLVAEWQRRRVGDQRRFRAVLSKLRPAGTMALPGSAARLRFMIAPDGVAYVHDPLASTLTTALRVEHSAMVLLSNDEQNERVNGWSRALSSLAGSGTLDHVAILEETIPDTGDGPLEYAEEHWTGIDDWPSQEYFSLLEAARFESSTHRTTVTLSVKIGRRGMADAVVDLAGQRQAFEYSLRNAGLRIIRWLNEEELAQQIRQAYAPFSAPITRSLSVAGPVAIEESWASLRHDEGYSCVLALAEFPAIPVNPQFLHSLIFTRGIHHTFTLVARVQTIDEALSQVRRDKVVTTADRLQKEKMGRLEEMSDRTEFSAIEAREAALLQGHAAVHLTGLITVSARTANELESAVAQIKRDANACACEARVLFGMQHAAFIGAALPVGRAL